VCDSSGLRDRPSQSQPGGGAMSPGSATTSRTITGTPRRRRIAHPAGCPFCAGTFASVSNRLVACFTSVAAELDRQAEATGGLAAEKIVVGPHRRAARCSGGAAFGTGGLVLSSSETALAAGNRHRTSDVRLTRRGTGAGDHICPGRDRAGWLLRRPSCEPGRWGTPTSWCPRGRLDPFGSGVGVQAALEARYLPALSDAAP
jgi:hypothetical protein